MLWVYNYKFQIKLIFAYFQMHVITLMVYLKISPEYILIIIMMALIEHIISIFCSYIKSIHFFSTKLIYIFLPDLISLHNESYNFILAGGCVSCRSSGKYNVYKLPPPPPLKMIDMQLTGKQGKKNKPVIWSFNNLTCISQLNNLFHLFLFPNILQNHFPRNISLRK